MRHTRVSAVCLGLLLSAAAWAFQPPESGKSAVHALFQGFEIEILRHLRSPISPSTSTITTFGGR